ncbi:probable arginine--tRNA ligase, cytoplasmic [Malaya genurostris]|uniref:probable arginine--tRNA ligase, cytoplasmic n=1 Tax=Malaya genurostris TaxID=325434 RepID=UPI0026F3BBFD|nr:probable arginine--tRNA ligase, cytoplasmic [Malaya genurostris]
MLQSVQTQLMRLQKLEDEIRLLQKAINDTQNNINLEENNPQLEELEVQNSKLKYRLIILNRAIAVEEQSSRSMVDEPISILDHLTDLFTKAISKSFPLVCNEVATVITASSSPKFGDYQCNNAMQLVQKLKAQNIKISPRDVANKIMESLPKSAAISKVEIAGAGYVNVYLDKSYGVAAIMSILKQGVRPPYYDKKRVIVDFSSPNIAKEMHVGHLRSTIIGESISRFLEFLGHDVLRLNHVGDWGTQFGMLIAHLQDKFPNYLNVSPPIGDLQAFYKESKTRFDSDEEFKKRAYSCVVQLQSGKTDSLKAWTMICDVSRKEFQKIYDRLDVTLIERGESFYQKRMENIVRELSDAGFLEEDEGRKIMWGEDRDGIPLTIVKSDGGFTYDTSDMAAIKQRLQEEKGDWLIYVTDAGQATHFQTLYSCARRAGILDLNMHRVDHVGFGVVLGEDGKKFKTRSGDTVRLIELLDEGLKRSLNKLLEKGRDKVLSSDELKAAQESVAYGCIKYADLSHNRNNEYIFSFDKMLEDKGNTAVYLLYSYTRIRSIARNCGGDFANNIEKVIASNEISVEHEKEWKLVKVLLKFTDVMKLISKNLCLHHLCEFVYDVSTTFTEFYDTCYCIEKNKQGEIVKINTGRVLLCEATSRVLGKCFDILGLKPLHKI